MGLMWKGVLGRRCQPRLSGAGYDLYAEDRISAQFEEVVRYPDSLKSEHLSPNPRKLLLDGRARFHVVFLSLELFRRWQCSQVHFPARHERERVQQHYRGGQHVLRQLLL